MTNEPFVELEFECPICHRQMVQRYGASQSKQYVTDLSKKENKLLFCNTCIVKLHIPTEIDVAALIAENATVKFKMSMLVLDLEELRADNMKLVEYLIATDPSFVDQSLREAGYDPDEIGKKFGKFARDLLDKRRKQLGLDDDTELEALKPSKCPYCGTPSNECGGCPDCECKNDDDWTLAVDR